MRSSKGDIKLRLREKYVKSKGGVSICLVMIVKNESRNIERLIKSLLGIIDMICITDTGSVDNTVEIIKECGLKYQIPNTVHQSPFKDFGTSRTESYLNAKKTYPSANYFLLSDADFIWDKVGMGIDKKKLTCDEGMVLQQGGTNSYWNVRLLSSKVEWRCIGLTHEEWKATSKVVRSNIEGIFINDVGDGGCKEDKFERDEMLLRRGLEDPKTKPLLRVRYLFYLANTLRDLGRYREAIDFYTKRVNAKGWEEEVYNSLYNIGKCYEEMGCEKESNIQESVNWYIKAYEYRPKRADSLARLATLYRRLCRYQEAYDISMIGVNIPVPKDDILFIEHDLYNHIFTFELSIVSFYIPEHRDEGLVHINTILKDPLAPRWMKESCRENLKFYE